MECYICTEPAFTLSPCKCTNLYIHDHCYATLIAYNHTKCSICLEEYPIKDTTKDIESMDEEEDDEPIKYNMCVPILLRSNLKSYHSCDILLEPFRHLLIVFFLMNVLKIIFQPDMYLYSVYREEDIIYFLFALTMHCMYIIFVRLLSTNDTENTN